MSVLEPGKPPSLWVEQLTLDNFRNYASLKLELHSGPVVLIGENGAGKTNLMEAVSLLAPGQGMRRATFADLARVQAGATEQRGDWTISARVHTQHGEKRIGTGVTPEAAAKGKGGRIVRIDGESARGSGALADYVEMVWLIPAMDGLFTGAAGERRRFLDRLILNFDPGYRTRMSQFERAMRQRNKLLDTDYTPANMFEGLELQMAEMGVAIAAARIDVIDRMREVIETKRDRNPDNPFPWATLVLDGDLERDLAMRPAIEVEDSYVRSLAEWRDRDRAAKRTLKGPHRSDLIVGHGPKSLPAHVCSTGEQKALLVGVVLAHAELLAHMQGKSSPILLLDEIAAHLDEIRRVALFQTLLELGAQAWMTGTDRMPFEPLKKAAQILVVEDGSVSS